MGKRKRIFFDGMIVLSDRNKKYVDKNDFKIVL